jgi:hypothetical protein
MMHNIGKLSYAQRLAILNGRKTKDIPGLTLGQRLRINRHREREEHREQESKSHAEEGPLLVEQEGGVELHDDCRSGDLPEPAPSQDQEAEAEDNVAAPAKKRRAPRKKG